MFKTADYQMSAEYLSGILNGFVPETLLILGSGLGFLADQLEDAKYIPYDDIPHFRRSTAPGHAGRLVAGILAGKKVLAMQGRLHLYEGYTPQEIAYPIRVANLLGANKLIITCACGGVNTTYKVGDITVLTDYINLGHGGPLIGFDLNGFPNRFVDMTYVFDRGYLDLAHNTASKENINLKNGVYYYMPGPEFETPAQIKAIRTLGGDLVGMSTVFEVIMARRLNMKVTGFGLVTNMAAGILDQPLTEEEVLVEGKKASDRFSRLLKEFIRSM